MSEEREQVGVLDAMNVVSSIEVPFQASSSKSKDNPRSIIKIAPPASSAAHKAKSVSRPQHPSPEEKPKGKIKRRFNCTVDNCHYSTPYSKDLARHMRKHTGEKPFSCDRCSKSYSRYDKLLMHTRIHDGIRPFKCKVCDYATVDSGSLRKHQRVHTDERPYKCQLCPYAAKESSQLVVHLRTHTGDSPYFCTKEGCDAAFKTPSDLQRHSRLHTGEKPYSCSHPNCSYKAAVKSNLNVHVRKHHKKPQNASSTGEEASENGINTSKHMRAESCVVITTHASFPNLEAIDPIVLTDETGQEIAVAMPSSKTEVGTVQNLESTQPHSQLSHMPSIKNSESGSNLPYQYACKQCPYKADTYKLFAVHMSEVHEGKEKCFQVIKPKTKVGGGKVGRPRPARRIKGKQAFKIENTSIGSNLQKFYDCTHCSASFVREDSLRCHMRQHSSSHPFNNSSIVQNNHRLIQQSTSSSDSNIVRIPFSNTVPSFCYQVPFASNTPSDSNITSIIGPETEVQANPYPQQEVQVASVITQNPAVINTNISNSSGQHQHIYIISPGGSTIHAVETIDDKYIL